jgi:hypothetical protein
MRVVVIRQLLVVFGALVLVCAFPWAAAAQEVSLSGSITDATDAALPGVTVTALHVDTGNTFVGVTDERGNYRIGALRIGAYRVTAELPGFTTLTNDNLSFSVGQAAVLNLKMSLSSVQESVTVTGEAPLLAVNQSKLGGTIDAKQMQELPLNGRNWMQLTLLAPGNRANAVTDAPTEREGRGGQFNLVVDGQQVTATGYGANNSGEPRFSRDAISEFEFISNRFDATQGRSVGAVVNVVTKSGTNLFSGSAAGYFRSDKFMANDLVLNRKPVYSDQQYSGSFGGPIKRDRAHFFSAFEYEREPRVIAFTSPYPAFNIPDLDAPRTEKKSVQRVDIQFSQQTRLTLRASFSNELQAIAPSTTGGASNHPSTGRGNDVYNKQYFANVTRVINNHALNEIKIGYIQQKNYQCVLVVDVGPRGENCAVRNPVEKQGLNPRIQIRGYNIGHSQVNPVDLKQDEGSFRDDFSTTLGDHQMTVGGEFNPHKTQLNWFTSRDGWLLASNGTIAPALLQSLFPVWNDPSSWSLQPLSPFATEWRQTVAKDAEGYHVVNPQKFVGVWFQDNWRATSNLTLNLGARYDYNPGAMANDVVIPQVRPNPIPTQKDMWAPRFGFAYTPDSKTVIRGGAGRYFGWLVDQSRHFTRVNAQLISPFQPFDGRADFAINPYNGNRPTFDQAQLLRHDLLSNLISPNSRMPEGVQGSIGLQRQLASNLSVQSDYVYTKSNNEVSLRNANLVYNPATGANYPSTDTAHLVWNTVGYGRMSFQDSYSNYHGWETAFTKRFSQRWQATGTYTLSMLKDKDSLPINAGCQYPYSAVGVCDQPITLRPDMGGEYGLAATDQRHRAVINGIWQLPVGLQLSGVYFYGSGQRRATTAGADRRATGDGDGRLRADGTIIPRNTFIGTPIHRVDMRLQKRITLGGRRSIDGVLEVFNVFNHENFGSYTLTESNANYGRPTQNLNVAYGPRAMQLGFKFLF